MLFNARWLGTDQQSSVIQALHRKNISTSKIEQVFGNSTGVSSTRLKSVLCSPRTEFVIKRVISIVCALATERVYRYICMDFLPQYFGELEITDFAPAKEQYIRRIMSVSCRETIIRAWVVTFFILYSVLIYSTIHSILAILFVGSGLNQPEDWQPLFGDIRKATSIRSFWGKFWHRLVYRSYTSYGVWISRTILRLPQCSFRGRLFINLFVFAASGAMHALAVWQAGYSCGFWEELHFYILNFVAIFAETVALATFSKVTRGRKVNATVSSTIGYFWVFMFLFWALPKSQYSKILCSP